MTENEMVYILNCCKQDGKSIPKIACENVTQESWAVVRNDGARIWHIVDACTLVGVPLPDEAPKTNTWTVVLTWYHHNEKIAAIKSVREMCGLGLKEAKELVEAAPVVVLRGLPQTIAVAIEETYGGGDVSFNAMREPNTWR